MLDRILAFFGLRRAAYVSQAVVAASRDAFIAGHAQGQQIGYQLGHAQGELAGRKQQILELQQEFGLDDNHNAFESEDALRYGARLKH
jgi:hypothetical protein